MPLMLTPAERAMLDRLAAPVDQGREPEFVAAVEAKLQDVSPAAIGEGWADSSGRRNTIFVGR